MEFWSCVSEVLSCLFFPLYSFSYERNVSFFLCPKIRYCLSCNMLHKWLLTVWSDDLERGFLWSLFWGFDGSSIQCLKCLNYKTDSCIFFVNWNTILRRNLRAFPVAQWLGLCTCTLEPNSIPGPRWGELRSWVPQAAQCRQTEEKKKERRNLSLKYEPSKKRGSYLLLMQTWVSVVCLCIRMSAFVLNYISLMSLCLQSCHTSETNILLYWKYWGSLIYNFIHMEFQGISIG